jgi:hypothetical protein
MFNAWKKALLPYHHDALLDIIPEMMGENTLETNPDEDLSAGAKEYLHANFEIDLDANPLIIATLVWGYNKNVLKKDSPSFNDFCKNAKYYNLCALQHLYAIGELSEQVSLATKGLTSLISQKNLDQASKEVAELTQGKISKIGVDLSPGKSVFSQVAFAFGIPIFGHLDGASDEVISRAKDVYDEMISVETNATDFIYAFLDKDTDLTEPLNEFFDNFFEKLAQEYEIENWKVMRDAVKDSYKSFYQHSTARDPFQFFQKFYSEDITDAAKREVTDIDEKKYHSDPKYAYGCRQKLDKFLNKKAYTNIHKICLNLLKIKEENQNIPEVRGLYDEAILTVFALKLFDKHYFLKSDSFEALSQANPETQEILKAFYHNTMFLKGAEIYELQDHIARLQTEFAEIENADQLTAKSEKFRKFDLPKKIKSTAEFLLGVKKVFDRYDPDFHAILTQIYRPTDGENDLTLEASYFSISEGLSELAELAQQTAKLFTDKCDQIEAAENSQATLELRKQAEELAAQEAEIQDFIAQGASEAATKKQLATDAANLRAEKLKNTITINNDKLILDDCYKATHQGVVYHVYCSEDALRNSGASREFFESAQKKESFAGEKKENGPKLFNDGVYELKINSNPRLLGVTMVVKDKDGQNANLIYFSKYIANPHGDKKSARKATKDIKDNPPAITYQPEYGAQTPSTAPQPIAKSKAAARGSGRN